MRCDNDDKYNVRYRNFGNYWFMTYNRNQIEHRQRISNAKEYQTKSLHVCSSVYNHFYFVYLVKAYHHSISSGPWPPSLKVFFPINWALIISTNKNYLNMFASGLLLTNRVFNNGFGNTNIRVSFANLKWQFKS